MLVLQCEVKSKKEAVKKEEIKEKAIEQAIKHRLSLKVTPSQAIGKN